MYLIFIAVLFIATPYTINKDISLKNSVEMAALQQNAPCSQKSPTTPYTQCNPNGTYVFSTLLNIHENLQLQLGLMIFFTYLAALCSGFKTSIYKPPKIVLQR
jgi:hypothetical protein